MLLELFKSFKKIYVNLTLTLALPLFVVGGVFNVYSGWERRESSSSERFHNMMVNGSHSHREDGSICYRFPMKDTKWNQCGQPRGMRDPSYMTPQHAIDRFLSQYFLPVRKSVETFKEEMVPRFHNTYMDIVGHCYDKEKQRRKHCE